MPPVSSSKTVSTGTTALATVPRTICAKESFAQNKFALRKNHEADDEQRQNADAQRIRRKRVETKSAENGEQRDGDEVRVQRRINHEGRQQIHLRAEQMPQAGQRGFAEHREQRGGKNQNGVQQIHGNGFINTQTCSSAPRLADSFTRASV